MIGEGYWSTGMTVEWIDREGGQWGAKLSFNDDGFADDDPAAEQVATEGELRTRYYVSGADGKSGLEIALDVLMADAARLGIKFTTKASWPPSLYSASGDTAALPQHVQDEMVAQAERLGWETLAQRSVTS